MSCPYHAHSKGIIHSDLKPGNIFATKDNAKVLDFGIARSISSATIAGDFDAGSLGALTPGYATLEMFEGDEPHPSDDVYAAAIIAYQLLTGKHPYNHLSAQELATKASFTKPTKPEGLSKHQWLALESALAIQRKNRTSSIKTFLDNFTQVKKFPYFKVISASLLIAVGVLGYMIFSAPNQVAIAIENTYKKAELCSQNNDVECAIESSRAVLELAPKHTQALQLLAQATEKQTLNYEQEAQKNIAYCIAQSDLICAQETLAHIKSRVPNSKLIAQIEDNIEALNTSIALKNSIKKSQNCLQNNDIHCALDFLNEAKNIAPNDSSIVLLQQLIDVEQAKKAAATAAQDNALSTLLNKANKCLNSKNYTCVISTSDEALKIAANDTRFLSLKQKALSEESQHKENINSAERLVKKASECYNKKNFTCAIANAESALEFAPNYKPAVTLIEKSKNQIKTLKSSLNIN